MTEYVTVNDLNIWLKQNKNYDVYSTEELQTIIDNYTIELAGLCGLEIEPTSHTDVTSKQSPYKVLELNYYPVSEIESITVDDRTVSSDDYVLKKDSGVIMFKSIIIPSDVFVTVEYKSCADSYVLDKLFKPLLRTYIQYQLAHVSNEPLSSVKEGNVQLNYDSNNSSYSVLKSRIEYIRNYYARVEML